MSGTAASEGNGTPPGRDQPHEARAEQVRAWLQSENWAGSEVGPPEAWPDLLRNAAGIVLGSPSPMLLLWGKQFLLLYNDAAAPLLGEKHPHALASEADVSRAELWDVVSGPARTVLDTGRPRAARGQLLVLERGGLSEERYLDLHCSPVLDAARVSGVLCAIEDTTRDVLARRRIATLADLAGRIGEARDESAVWRGALAALERNPADLPFAILYRTAEAREPALLAGSIGVASGSPLAPEHITIDAPFPEAPWPLGRITLTLQAEQANGALVLPVLQHGTHLCGFLIAGVSPRQPLDHPYRDFLERVAERLAAGIAAVRAREENQRRAEHLERLRDRLERRCAQLYRLFEQAPVPIVVLGGRELRIEMANPAALAVVEGRDVIGKPLIEALPELAGQGYAARLQEVLRTGQPDVGREVHVRLVRDGRMEDSYFTFVSARIERAGEDESDILMIASEVTEQVQARAAIRASEARYRTIFENVDVSIWEEDYSAVRPMLEEVAADGPDLRAYLAQHPEALRPAFELVKVVDVNDASLRLFGARDKQELLQSLRSALLPETMNAFAEKLVAIFEQRPLLRLDTAVRTLQGEIRDVMLTMAMPPACDGKVLVTLADITERIQMEQALREADRHKDEFLATLAHELRNPLAPLQSCAELLSRTEWGEAPPHVLEIVKRQVDHLVRLADDLLETSRIRRGGFELRRERITLDRLVRNALETSEPLIQAAGHTLTVDLPEEPVWIDGDAMRLAQVISNLLNNAAKYTPPGGRIDVSAHRENDRVAITISDNGMGIPPEALPRLFDMFTRLGRPGEAAEGLGVGLALAHTLIEMHGGTIEARSEGLGRGSEFVLRLPTAVEAEPARRARTPARRSIARRRVLVVDDNPDAAESLRMVLRRLGAEVRVAERGPRALATFGAFHPQLVLLDLGLPGMSGYEVARRLRAEFPDRDAVLVALTGWSKEEDRQRAREAGFDRYVVKPADIGTLRELLGADDGSSDGDLKRAAR